ncbi:MAG: sodium:proton antiporter [Opitutales bacterium]
MLIVGSILVGFLFGLGTYLVLQRSFVRVLFGFILISNAANLSVLHMSGRPEGLHAPVVRKQAEAALAVDPLPQALVLTAIVIGFGMAAYLVFLLYRVFLDWETTDAGELGDKPHPRLNPPDDTDNATTHA